VPDVKLLTNSEMRAFKRCRRAWWLRWVRRLRRALPERPGPRSLGSRVHAALAAYYAPAGYPDVAGLWATWEALATADRATVAVAAEEGEDPAALAEALEEELELGRLMLEGYLEWLADEGADEGLEVIGPEVERRVPLGPVHGVNVDLLALLDLRLRREVDGARLFLDHKTLDQFSRVEPTAHLDEQFRLYHLIERLLGEAGERTDGALINLLRRVKRTARATPPFYRRLEVRHNDHDLRSFWTRVSGTAVDLMEAELTMAAGLDPRAAAYPNPTRDCAWDCEYFPICGLFDDGSDVESLLADRYESRHPLAGRYAKLLTADELREVER